MSGILQASEVPPAIGQVTVAEVECRFLVRDANEESNLAAVSMGVCDMYIDAASSLVDYEQQQNPTHHFIPVTEHWLKRAINTWRNDGIINAMESVATNPVLGDSCVRTISSWLLGLTQWAESTMTNMLDYGSMMTSSEMIVKYSLVSDWVNSPVRAMDFHPRMPYIAIAKQDDTVEIRCLTQMEPSIVLRDKDQYMVTCLQWAPHANTLLAVGAKVGVLLWNVDPSLPTSRFLTSWVRVETSPRHVPVTTISWCPRANYLISGSADDSHIIVWDIAMCIGNRVRRKEGRGVYLVSVSPDGGHVFAASVSNVMRVWETENWTCEKWINASSSRCQAACWSPSGDFLIFSLHGDHNLYYLCFHGNNTAGSVSAIKCAHLSSCVHPVTREDDITTIVGGPVQSMCWDSTGQRLAIIFTADSPGHGLVAVLRTRVTSSLLEILPGGFVRGDVDDVPQLITFQPNCCQGGLLATAWLSGRISFTRLIFYTNATLLSSSLTNTQHHSTFINQSHLYSTQKTSHTHSDY